VKALFLVGRPGHSTVIMNSYSWEKTFFRFEDEANGDTRQKDDELIRRVEEEAPDVCIYIAVCLSPKQFDGSEPHKGVPYDSTFRKVRDTCPSVMICCDGGDVGWERLLHRYHDGNCFDLMVDIDGVLDWPLKDKPGCFVGLNPWPWPADLPIKALSRRSVDFGFHGALGLGSRRWQMCEELKRTAGLSVHARGCVSDPCTMPYNEYARRISEFKIALNMAWSGMETCLHVKGRVLEYGFAGCCLLENRGSWAKEWFTPGVDYIEYEDAGHAAGLAQELLADLHRSQVFADNLRKKVNEQYNAERFWTSVLGKAGIK
jgi:hypothetical protein